LSLLSGNNHKSFGWCGKCAQEHCLEEGNSRQHALKLMQELKLHKRIDFHNPSSEANPRFSTDYLFGPARGQMFGVLECRDENDDTVILRAFSGQYNAAWNADGWVPPLFDVEAYDRIMIPGDQRIKKLGRKMVALKPGDHEFANLKKQRKELSRTIMKELHDLYELNNFMGEKSSLNEFFKSVNGPPTGAGDCCAPKLLNYAARHNLRPMGVSEFFWGETNPSKTRVHGQFYSSCTDKCLPILGFMLCGAGV